MNYTPSDYRYQYESELSDLIGLYTTELRKKNPFLFYYRGINLVYAIERELYFKYISSEKMFQAFLSGLEDKDAEEVLAEDDLEYFFLTQFKTRPINKKMPETTWFKEQVSLLRSIGKNLKHILKAYLTSFKKNKAKIRFQGAVVLHIVQPKFYRYLENVLNNLTDRAIVIITTFDTSELGWSAKKFNLINGQEDLNSGLPFKWRASKYLRKYFTEQLKIVDRFLTFFKNSRPAKIFLVEGNTGHDEILNQIGKHLNIEVICFQQGWSPIVHSGFRNFNFSKMLMWGDGFIELMRTYNPSQNFISVGTHILKEPAKKDYEKIKGVAFFLQSVSKIITKSVWEDFLNLIEWTAGEFKDHSVLIREHPSSPLLKEEKEKLNAANIYFVNAPSFTLDDIFKLCTISVSIFSTTILESIHAGVIPIVYNPALSVKYNPDIEIWNAGIEVKTVGDAKRNISRLLMDEDSTEIFKYGMKAFSSQFFFCSSDAAIENISKELT